MAGDTPAIALTTLKVASRGCAGIRMSSSSPLQTRIPRQDLQASLELVRVKAAVSLPDIH